MIKVLMVTVLLIFWMTGCTGSEKNLAPSEAVAMPGEKVPAYYYAEYLASDEAQKKLASVGFEVIGTYAVLQAGETIVITHPELKKNAVLPGRGESAILRIFIDEEHHRLTYTNPVYFGKAFLQNDFIPSIAQQMKQLLDTAFGESYPSEDGLVYDEISTYHFMVGMPYFENKIILAEGNTSAALRERLASFDDGNRTVYKLLLAEDKMLVGFRLSRLTEQFVKTIGIQNAALLPYTIMIEDGRATALSAKYYIAISYPQLSMRAFMNIARTPGAIEKELKAPFVGME